MESKIEPKVRAKGQGRKAKDGATGLVRVHAAVTPAQKALIAQLGGSVWLRKLIDDSQRPTPKPEPYKGNHVSPESVKLDTSDEAKARAKAFDDSLFDDGPPESPDERRARTERALAQDAKDRNDPNHWKYGT